MDSPQNQPNVSSQYDKDVQDLLKRLTDATCKLQRVMSEREEVNAEVHQWREEMDRRMLLLLHADERVCDALMELEAAKQKKQALIELIQSLNTHAGEKQLSSVSLSVTQKRVDALEEEEEKLNLQCEQVRKALEDTQDV